MSAVLFPAPLLSVERLSIQFGTQRVVDDVSFALWPGKTLCIAGESGSGKSLTSLAIMGLLPEEAQIPGGAIIFDNQDLLSLPERQMQLLRGKSVAMIFQEPMTSLNPLMTVGQQLEETLQRHEVLGRRERRSRVSTMLDAVKISHVEKRLQQYPHELSGGMRQRVMIAMAMLCQPQVLIADEPTTALDVTIQAQILELMRELQQAFSTSLLLITHDMGVVAEMADDVLVMSHGKIMEQAPAKNAVYLAAGGLYPPAVAGGTGAGPGARAGAGRGDATVAQRPRPQRALSGARRRPARASRSPCRRWRQLRSFPRRDVGHRR
ncbi:putative phosphonate C-P lyase system protein PhnK [Klebsiella pneumoniae]|nr:putative phosphonate C-P lyase system protein PhnK [Klebsiella pneumoniae]